MKSLVAMLALALGLTFGMGSFAQAEDKAATPAGEMKGEMKKDEGKKAEGKKAEKKETKKADKK